MTYLFIFIGGGLGAITRYGASNMFNLYFTYSIPHATFWINTIGSFFIGLLSVLFQTKGTPPLWQLFFITGFLGGFTTFSTFSLEALSLWLAGEHTKTLLYLMLHLTLTLFACFLGIKMGQRC